MTREEIIAMREKIELIDTNDNRSIVANNIVAGIFAKCKLPNDDKDTARLYSWLYNNIMGYTLADAILTDFKVYIIRLAKKVCSDICYISKPKDVDEFLDVVNNWHCKIGDFINVIFYHTDFVEDIDKFYAEVQHNTEVIGFEDTLILDKTTYVLDNTGRPCYVVKLHIGYHPNYTIDNLRKRIEGRLHYQWRGVVIKSIYVEKACDGSYFAQIILFSDNDLDTIEEMIEYRFGPTSGKPWYRCSIVDVQLQTPANK